MITSKQIINISEKYITSKKVSRGNLEIFENPSRDEIRTVLQDSVPKSDTVRFIADSRKNKVYVFNSELALHEDVVRMIGLGSFSSLEWNPVVMMGEAIGDSGKLSIYNVATLEMHLSTIKKGLYSDSAQQAKNYVEKVLSNNWSWLGLYFDYQYYIDKAKKSLKEIIDNFEKDPQYYSLRSMVLRNKNK